MAPDDRREDQRRREREPEAAAAHGEREQREPSATATMRAAVSGTPRSASTREGRVGIVLEGLAQVAKEAHIVGDAREREEQQERRGRGDRLAIQPRRGGPSARARRRAARGTASPRPRTRAPPRRACALAVAPHERDEQRRAGARRSPSGSPRSSPARAATTPYTRQSRTRASQSAATSVAITSARREPVGHARREDGEGTTGSTAAIGQSAFARSARSASGASIRVPAVHDGLGLPIQLVMEVERQPVVSRVRRERQHEHEDGRMPRRAARARRDASTSLRGAR